MDVQEMWIFLSQQHSAMADSGHRTINQDILLKVWVGRRDNEFQVLIGPPEGEVPLQRGSAWFGIKFPGIVWGESLRHVIMYIAAESTGTSQE